jgi:transglutaminase-like putative cysteine protease
MQSQPKPVPEDSLALRILVQALVTVGIIATGVAAPDSSSLTRLWAVPMSWVGAGWSWRRRRHQNIATKFGIAIAMLVALAVFFVRLIAERNDTRLALAELLIQLQVFHSFDLPRRKDLGYSVVIGLILIGVAATLSQTLAFAPLLLLFLAIALPVMMLDYRSRLGLGAPTLQQVKLNLSPQRFAPVLLITIGLGLAIFLLLPRFPGYQLRAFPVSAPIPLQEQFQQSVITNPGYVNEGRGNGGGGAGTDGRGGSGEQVFNPDFYYGFSSRMNQNLRGQLQPRVVMRVRSQAPGFWRVMAFDQYTGQGWEVSRNAEDQVEKLERPGWSFRFNLPWSVTLNKTREVVQTYTIASDLPNLIPTLYEAKELYFPTNQIGLDKEGSFRSPVPLSEGLTYSVVSEVPYRNRTQLQKAKLDFPKRAIGDHYLQVPEAIAPTLRQTTEAILARSPKPIQAPSEKALYLAQYLKQTYRIQPDLPPFAADQDLATAFLTQYEGGYPDHFSTVLTLMLRSIGIPARLTVGFGTGQFNPFTGFYVVKNTDAFALTEVYFHKYGWFTFDPIPGHPLIPPSIEESKVFGVLQQFWNWIAGWLPSPLTGLLTAIVERVLGAIAWIMALFTQGWMGILAGLGILTGFSFLFWLTWRGWHTLRYRHRLAQMPPMESLYQQMLDWQAERGMGKMRSQTPLEYAAACREGNIVSGARGVGAIEEISRAYVDWRYGQKSVDVTYLRGRLQELRRQKVR